MAGVTVSVQITTSNTPRPVLQSYDLTTAERAEFDYIDWAAVDDGRASAEFVRYHGRIYDLGDTEGVPDQKIFPGWDLYITDSFYSGVLFRWPRVDGEIDTEVIICGTWAVKG